MTRYVSIAKVRREYSIVWERMAFQAQAVVLTPRASPKGISSTAFFARESHLSLYNFDHFLHIITIIYIKIPGNGVLTEFKTSFDGNYSQTGWYEFSGRNPKCMATNSFTDPPPSLSFRRFSTLPSLSLYMAPQISMKTRKRLDTTDGPQRYYAGRGRPGYGGASLPGAQLSKAEHCWPAYKCL